MSHGGYQPGTDPRDWQTPVGPQSSPQTPGPEQAGYGRPADYGQPGYGWQGAYDQQYGVDPQQSHGRPGYGPQPGYVPYPPYPPRNDGTRTHAIVALVISIVLALSCYVSLGGIAGAILSGIALSKVDTEPHTSRNLLKWTWIAIGVNVALIVAGIVFGVIYGIATS